MNVADLIAILQTYPAESEVIVTSYEEGYDPVTTIDCIPITVATPKVWYNGVYADADTPEHMAVLIRSHFLHADKVE
jgi:hypothetical protein